MVRGWPDYTRVTGLVENYDEFGNNYPIGIGDGASRLGSIKTYDMRGRVWWMDDFEAGVLHWPTSSVGVGGSQALTNVHARYGSVSTALVSNTGAGRESQIIRHLPQPRQRQIGIEMSFSAQDNFGFLEMRAELFTGANSMEVGIQFDEAALNINYLNAAGGWTNTGMFWADMGNLDLFHACKIVLNYQTLEYIRILFDDQEVALAGIPIQQPGLLWDPQMIMTIDNVGNNVNNVAACIDDVIITIMEPD